MAPHFRKGKSVMRGLRRGHLRLARTLLKMVCSSKAEISASCRHRTDHHHGLPLSWVNRSDILDGSCFIANAPRDVGSAVPSLPRVVPWLVFNLLL